MNTKKVAVVGGKNVSLEKDGFRTKENKKKPLLKPGYLQLMVFAVKSF